VVGLLGYLAYLVADVMGLSAILSLFVASILVSHYGLHSLSEAGRQNTLTSFKWVPAARLLQEPACTRCCSAAPSLGALPCPGTPLGDCAPQRAPSCPAPWLSCLHRPPNGQCRVRDPELPESAAPTDTLLGSGIPLDRTLPPTGAAV